MLDDVPDTTTKPFTSPSRRFAASPASRYARSLKENRA